MNAIALVAFFFVPLAGMAFGGIWGLWRALALAFSRSVPGEIVDWTPVQTDGDVGKPDFDRYAPVVSYRAHDGVLRKTQFRRPYDAPIWRGPGGPVVHYRLWPTLIAEEAPVAFWGPPVALFVVSTFALTMGVFLGMDRADWALLEALAGWRP